MRWLVGLSVAGFMFLRYARMWSVGGSFDSALLGNVLWRLANGLDSQTAMTGGHYLATHASPALGVFSGVMKLVPIDGIWLVAWAQSVSIGLAVWGGYLVGRSLGLRTSTLFWLACSALLSAAAWIATQHQFNETVLGVGPLAMSLAVGMRNGPISHSVLWLALAAACRIEMAAAALVGAIIVWSLGRTRQGVAMLTVSVLFLIAYLTWLFVNPYPTESIAAHFAHLGSTPMDVMSTMVTSPWKVLRPAVEPIPFRPLFFWLLPFGLVPALAQARLLWIAVAPAAVAILGVWPPADQAIEHYWTTIFAAGAIAAPLGLVKAPWLERVLKPLLVTGVLASWVALSPYFGLMFPVERLTPDDREFVSVVRDLDSGFVAAPSSIAFALVDRPLLAPFPRPFACSEMSIGPYTAPDVPPSVIVMPHDAYSEATRDKTVTAVGRLLDSYAVAAGSTHFVALRVVDVAAASADYLPCSSSTFSTSE